MKNKHNSRKEASWRRLIYACVFVFLAFFLLLDLLVGTISRQELLVLLAGVAAILLMLEGAVRLWQWLERISKK